MSINDLGMIGVILGVSIAISEFFVNNFLGVALGITTIVFSNILVWYLKKGEKT